MVKRILVPIDGSIQSLKALPMAVKIARLHQAELALLTVTYFAKETDAGYATVSTWLDSPMIGSVGKYVERVFAAAKEIIPKDVKVATYHLSGQPEETILDFVSENDVDMIAIGCKHVSFVDKIIKGSISRHIIEKAKCPVIIVK